MCLEESFIEIRDLEPDVSQFLDFLTGPKTDTAKQPAILSLVPCDVWHVLSSIAKDFADFFLHAAAVAFGTTLELGLHGFRSRLRTTNWAMRPPKAWLGSD